MQDFSAIAPRERKHISCPNRLCGIDDPSAIEPNMPFFDDFARQRPAFGEAQEEQ